MLAGATTKRVLVVDDDPAVRDELFRVLNDYGYEVATAWTAEGALESLAGGTDVQAVITGVHLPGMDGRALVDRLAARWPHIKPILIDTFVDGSGYLETENAGAVECLRKPVDPEVLIRVLDTSVGLPPEMPSDYWVN